MYRALYEYKSALPGYLSFRAGDQFTIIGSVNQDWFSAQNGLGEIGNVPRNYVKSVQSNADEVLKFVDWSIEAIHLQATDEGSGQYTHEQRATLQKLVQHRNDIAKQLQSRPPMDRSRSDDVTCHEKPKLQQEDLSRRHSAKRHAPPPPSASKESSGQKPGEPELTSPGADTQLASSLPDVVLPSPPDGTDVAQVNHTQADSDSNRSHQAQTVSSSVDNQHSQQDTNSSQPAAENDLPSPVADENASSEPATKAADVQELLKELEVPDKIGPELLEEVRKSTGLSFEKSKIAVETVLGYVGFKMPSLEVLMDRVLRSLHFGRDISDEDVTSHDAKRLGVIFSELTACKDDSQQRSWALHEDEAIIQEYLQELLSILENAKPSICRKVVSRDNYEILHSLVQYYQMEMRTELSLSLLKVFGALCALEKEVVIHLLYSVLPLELGQTLKLHTDEVQRVCYVTLLMTMIFSTGDDVSTTVTDQFNQEFFLHVLHLIEDPPSVQFEDDAVDLLISFILSFNLHLTSVDTNVVLSALAAFGTPKIFTERIMVLINRGTDPVKMFDFKPQPPNSVLKLFHDLYADLTTADLLYTNDAKVLMDVIVGRLSNLSPGDKVRSSFLLLCQKVVQNSLYTEHCHRAGELQVCLETICGEEADTPDDKRIALDIMCKDPEIFPRQ